MRIDPLCTAIRLSPLWICLAVHHTDKKWTIYMRGISRVMEYGFSVNKFKQNPIVLLTHMFIHANDAHLINNMLVLIVTLGEFGGSSLRENLEDNNMMTAIYRTIGSFIVLISGGIIGGIGGQLLFNDIQLKQQYKQGFFFSTGKEKNTLWIGNIWDSMCTYTQNWLDGIKYKIDKKRSDSILMCGASAGICSLVGFNAAYYKRWVNATSIILPEIICLLCLCMESERSFKKSTWLQSGEIIGHAAHVGGFIVGFMMGTVWRWISCECRRGEEE